MMKFNNIRGRFSLIICFMGDIMWKYQGLSPQRPARGSVWCQADFTFRTWPSYTWYIPACMPIRIHMKSWVCAQNPGFEAFRFTHTWKRMLFRTNHGKVRDLRQWIEHLHIHSNRKWRRWHTPAAMFLYQAKMNHLSLGYTQALKVRNLCESDRKDI